MKLKEVLVEAFYEDFFLRKPLTPLRAPLENILFK